MGVLVSVIIPTYKRPFRILSKAVDSVLMQSYSNIEVIIVDDSPRGDSNRKEVQKNIKEISDKRVKYVQHEYNQGACKARNTGISLSNGNFIAFLDDDDEWLPQKLEYQLNKFNDPQVGLVYCDSYTIRLKNNLEVQRKIRSFRISGWVYDKLILENFIGSTSFVLLKKDTLDNCGLFNESLRSAQDCELWLRIAQKYKVDFVAHPLVHYYIHEGERISTNIDNKIQGLEMLNELNSEYLNSHPKANSISKAKITPYYSIKHGYKLALTKWYEAIKPYPFQRENLKYLAKIFYYGFRYRYQRSES